ncbi:Spo0B domain-containing protein [Virgibacillus sp. NKC19-16]|uniref:Spo0B domain-containing protein n=1 Tax=Virgibacillus salidurans TaxID=2831673 RepID=UPI001F357B4D|nr:Spo0B domain-containing protein [Virgibacillus sp. NKC19-16]UJL44960.1 Spo0B domain-containing protein [Virgibacillus sp. NKC19-16]
MKPDEVVQVLQHYRHDLMNHLQIVQGYLSMKKPDKAEAKLKETLDYYNEERKLMGLNAPMFMLWLIQFNSRFKNWRINYQIHTEYKDLRTIDNQLTEQCKHILSTFRHALNDTELFEVNLELNARTNPSQIQVRLFIDSGDRLEINGDKLNLSNVVDMDETTSGISCVFSIPWN